MEPGKTGSGISKTCYVFSSSASKKFQTENGNSVRQGLPKLFFPQVLSIQYNSMNKVGITHPKINFQSTSKPTNQVVHLPKHRTGSQILPPTRLDLFRVVVSHSHIGARVMMTPSHESINSQEPMFNSKKPGITNAIREKLGFADEGLWRKFSARRLELIDALDLSSRRASDQEENVKNVAQILRAEFQYGPDTLEDFEALVRAAVQSVRRNRKRGSKTGRANKKAKPDATAVEPDMAKSQFLSEIAHIADTQDAVYDMSYSTKTVVSNQDRSRAAIDTIIRPYEGPLSIRAPTGGENPASKLDKSIEREATLSAIRNTLLLSIKRSKSCLMVTMSAKNELYRVIGQMALSSVCMLMLERSFGGINKTSFEHIREKVTSAVFQAKFYRSLEPSSSASDSLDDETAAGTLHTLIGCCIQDFGYDFILQHTGDAFYHCILLEYPFVAKASVPFRRGADTSPPEAPPQKQLADQQSLKPLEDRQLEDKSFKDESFGDDSFGDDSFGDKSFGDKSFGDKSFGDKSLKESPEDKSLDKSLKESPEDKSLDKSLKESPEDKSLDQSLKESPQDKSLDQSLKESPQDKSFDKSLKESPGSLEDRPLENTPREGQAVGTSRLVTHMKHELPGHHTPRIPLEPEYMSGEYGSLDKLAAIASKLGPNYLPSISPEPSASPKPESQSHTKVTLRFLSSALNFTFPMATSAPPRYNEVLENGRQAFRLPDAQNYGLRNHKTGLAITDDSDLERLFSSHQQVDLEIHALRGSSLPLRDLGPRPAPAIPKRESPHLFPNGNFSRSHSVVSSESRIILPPPNLNVAINQMESAMPKFQPLL